MPSIKNNPNELELPKPSSSHYQKGKSSVNSAKNITNSKQRSPKHSLNSRIVKAGDTRSNLRMTSPGMAAPMQPSQQQDLPISQEVECLQSGMIHRQKQYSQTEINEADEDYPEDEVADEIPDDHNLHLHQDDNN